MDIRRFIIIAVCPDHIREKIDPLREKIAAITGAREALTYPPHVTLRTGLLVPSGKEQEALEGLRKSICTIKPFTIFSGTLIFTSYSDDKGAIRHLAAYEIEKNQGLVKLNKYLLRYRPYRKSDKTNFHPHLTLAFHDLSRAGLGKVETLYRNEPKLFPDLSWNYDGVSLYEKQDNTWQLFTHITQ
jgi:2'-5' RNA ligase